MTTENNNPFVLPGLGQSGELGKNPLLVSMEMMRQAWQGLAGTGSMSQAIMAAPVNVEDLDRRITDLRAVENWLRMNQTMLSSSIQALEVQRATIATIQSFIAPKGDHGSDESASPLDVALGLKPAGQAKIKPAASDSDKPQVETTQGSSAVDAWWAMLQKQFDTLATATAASMQTAEPVQAPAQEKDKSHKTAKSASTKTSPRKRAAATKTPRS